MANPKEKLKALQAMLQKKKAQPALPDSKPVQPTVQVPLNNVSSEASQDMMASSGSKRVFPGIRR